MQMLWCQIDTEEPATSMEIPQWQTPHHGNRWPGIHFNTSMLGSPTELQPRSSDDMAADITEWAHKMAKVFTNHIGLTDIKVSL